MSCPGPEWQHAGRRAGINQVHTHTFLSQPESQKSGSVSRCHRTIRHVIPRLLWQPRTVRPAACRKESWCWKVNILPRVTLPLQSLYLWVHGDKSRDKTAEASHVWLKWRVNREAGRATWGSHRQTSVLLFQMLTAHSCVTCVMLRRGESGCFGKCGWEEGRRECGAAGGVGCSAAWGKNMRSRERANTGGRWYM